MKKFTPILILLTLAVAAWLFTGARSGSPRFSIREVPPSSNFPAIAILTDLKFNLDYPIQSLDAIFPGSPIPRHFAIGFPVSHLIDPKECKPGQMVPAEALAQDSGIPRAK